MALTRLALDSAIIGACLGCMPWQDVTSHFYGLGQILSQSLLCASRWQHFFSAEAVRWMGCLYREEIIKTQQQQSPANELPKALFFGKNLMGHKITGCLLVKLFAFHTTRFRQIFSSHNKKSKKLKDSGTGLQRLQNVKHIEDWVLIVSSLLQWHQ